MANRKIQWHRDAHEYWGESLLVFWRLRFDDHYEYDWLSAALEAVCARHGVRSRVVYEVFGNHDLVLRCWVPRRKDPTLRQSHFHVAVDRMSNDLSHTLREYDQHSTYDRFVVADVWRHWWWDEPRVPPRKPLLADDVFDRYKEADLERARHLVDRVNAQTLSLRKLRSDDLMRRLEEDGVWRSNELRDGIKFITTVRLRPDIDGDHAREALLRIVDNATRVLDRSVYEGAGERNFADYLIVGRVHRRDYDAITSQIIMPLVSVSEASLYFRTSETCTTTSPSVVPFTFLDGLALPRDEDLVKVLRKGATNQTVFCGSVFKDARRWLQTGEIEARTSDSGSGFLSQVVALLNSRDEAEVIVGAIPLLCAPSATCDLAQGETEPDRPAHQGNSGGRICRRCRARFDRREGDMVIVGIVDPWSAVPGESVRHVIDGLWRLMGRRVEPDPREWLDIVVGECQGRYLARIKIGAFTPVWFYVTRMPTGHAFYVNDGGEPALLSGPDADRYKSEHAWLSHGAPPARAS